MFRLVAAALALIAAAPQDAPRHDSVRPELPALHKPAVLVFTKTNGWRHDSIPAAIKAITGLIEQRGWSAYATENGAVFNTEQLAKFDLVVFASATGDTLAPDQRAAFEAWLAKGRGFVALHGSGDGSHPAWYQSIVGTSKYTGHPGGADQFQTGELILLDRTHPATRHLPARWRWTEEYYGWEAPPRADAHILARLDETGMRFEPKQVMGDRHALIWWRCEGRARIFYSALGHRIETWSDASHLELIDGAIVWAARKTGKGCD